MKHYKPLGVLGRARLWLAEKLLPGKLRKPAQVRQFAAAGINRTTADWNALSTSGDAEVRTSLRLMRNRSRQLVRDNPYAKHAMRVIKNNVIGGGVTFQSQIKKRRGGKFDDDLNDKIEELFRQWCRAKNCDVTGQMSFAEMQRAVLGAVAESGEVLVRHIKGVAFGTSPVRFALQVFESDQLVDEWSGRTADGNEVRMGVEVDTFQRPVAYWMYPRHPGDFQFVPSQVQVNRLIRVPADELTHLYLVDRPNLSRGVPWMHSVMLTLNHTDGYEESELIAARSSAAIMGFIQSPETGAPDLDAVGADAVQSGERVYDFESGLIKELAPGETFTGWNPTRPNAAMDPFMRYMLRRIAAGIGLSYESLSRDYSQSNYSSSRLALLDDRDCWRVLQGWFIEHFLQPVFDNWLDMAVMSKALTLPDWEINGARYEAVRWQPRGWEWVDPLKEANAAIKKVRAGFGTLADELAKQGLDFEDVMRQRRRELDLIADLGLVLDTDPAQVAMTGVAQPNVAPAEEDQDDATGTAGEPAEMDDGQPSDTDDAPEAPAGQKAVAAAVPTSAQVYELIRVGK